MKKRRKEIYMDEFVEYVGYKIEKVNDLIEHLNMNGYNFGYDSNKKILFVFIEEKEYVETIMNEHKVKYEPIYY